MAWTNVGFDGTINEAQWASLSGLLGNDYVAAGNGDCLATAVGGSRAVSVAAGSLYGDGVLSTNSGAETVAMTTPVNGQWYVIALRRTWATNTAALVAIAGATTSTTTPTAPPTSFPTLNTNKGVLTDQPIAWAWCNSANTTVVVYDIRLKAVKSLPPVVANANERDAKFMTPTQGLQVWRDDLGAVETYFGLYNSSTNPGGRDTAGWYTSDRRTSNVPLKVPTVTITSGTGTVNALGTVTFSAATMVSLDGVFDSKYRDYLVVITSLWCSTPTPLLFNFRAGGTNYIGVEYQFGNLILPRGGGSTGQAGVNQSYAAIGTVSNYEIGMDIKLYSPAEYRWTKWTVSGATSGDSLGSMVGGGTNTNNQQMDGFRILPNAGTITGQISIYGIV